MDAVGSGASACHKRLDIICPTSRSYGRCYAKQILTLHLAAPREEEAELHQALSAFAPSALLCCIGNSRPSWGSINVCSKAAAVAAALAAMRAYVTKTVERR